MTNDIEKLTLYIDSWSSQCGNCGKGCDPREKIHTKVLGYGDNSKGKGCGVEWRYLSSHYIDKRIAENAKKMRPDLEPRFRNIF